MIDYTINIGHILQIAVLLGGGLYALVLMRGTVSNLKEDMTDMKTEIKKLGEVLVTLAVATKRLDNIEEDLRDMKHGRGFVRGRSGVEGEYP